MKLTLKSYKYMLGHKDTYRHIALINAQNIYTKYITGLPRSMTATTWSRTNASV